MTAIRSRRTRIVCTLGPATDRAGILERLIESGADVVRLNAAHGSEPEHARRLERVRRIARSAGRGVSVLLDLPGPKLRLGFVPGEGRELRRGQDVRLGEAKHVGEGGLAVDFPGFARHVETGQGVYLSDGSVRLVVRSIDGRKVRCRVVVGGTVRSGSGLNLPDSGLAIRLPTEDDARWLRFAGAHSLDWVGVSFVRSVGDLAAVRRRLGNAPDRPLLIAKIEKRQALENLESIVRAADGVMVARGDLGVETPLAEVPVAQKRIIAVANELGRPVVTATQMLESMVENPSPTRAEVGDVANAVLDGTDAVMLSAETAIGRHPLAAVKTLAEVIAATEDTYPYGSGLDRFRERDHAGAMAAQACRMSLELEAAALVIPTASVEAVAGVSRFRPRVPLIALAESERRFHQLALVWGVIPLRCSPNDPTDRRIASALRWLREWRIAGRGDSIVTLSASPLGGGRIDTLQVIDGRHSPREG